MALRIDSPPGDSSLWIERTYQPGRYRTQLTFEHPGRRSPVSAGGRPSPEMLQAVVEFDDINIAGLGDFFAELAQAFADDDPTDPDTEVDLLFGREWRSPEGEVWLRATNDDRVLTLAATLHGSAYSPPRDEYFWTVKGLLILHAAGLDQMARHAAQLAR